MIWDDRPRKARIADAVSRMFNVILFNGQPDESISGRSWRETQVRPSRKWWLAGRVANALYRDREHCRKAHENSIARSRARLAFGQ